MRALTIWPEWCFAICHLDKRIENRTWYPLFTMLGKDIAIHAGAHIGGRKMSMSAQIEAMEDVCLMAVRAGWTGMKGDAGQFSLTKGDPRRVDGVFFDWAKVDKSAVVAVAKLANITGSHTEGNWAVPGQYHYVLEDVRTLEKPVPCRGYQKLWELPPDVEDAVRIQI